MEFNKANFKRVVAALKAGLLVKGGNPKVLTFTQYFDPEPELIKMNGWYVRAYNDHAVSVTSKLVPRRWAYLNWALLTRDSEFSASVGVADIWNIFPECRKDAKR